MADRDLEERSHAYWRALVGQPQHRTATESLAEGYTRGQARHSDQRKAFRRDRLDRRKRTPAAPPDTLAVTDFSRRVCKSPVGD
jgi:hypothetical protein